MKRRVVVTGVGLLTPLGNDVQTTWGNLLAGKNGIAPLTRFESEMPIKVAGELKDFDVTKYMDAKEAKKMDRFTQYALVAAQEAFKDAGLDQAEVDVNRMGCWIGSGIGGLETMETQFGVLKERGYRRMSPFFVPMFIADMAAGQVSIALGAKGPNGCTVTACASGTNSIGDASRYIQYGDADIMITGGTEAAICALGMGGFVAARALSTNPDPETACRPFDKNRNGFIMGEGAGILILEEYEHAKTRGAKIYAELAGYGSSGDAYHITAPAEGGEGGARAMRLALKNAGMQPENIDYINAHGTSTQLNDKYETMAIKDVFGDHAYRLAVSSTKSMTGHLLGAAGAIEAIFSILSVQHDIVPPTIHFKEAEEEMDLDYVPNLARKMQVNAALSNSLGFGGHNACLIFKKVK